MHQSGGRPSPAPRRRHSHVGIWKRQARRPLQPRHLHKFWQGAMARRARLPILLDGTMVIQGSGAIIDWVDQRAQDRTRTLTLADALEIEQRADRVNGAHVHHLSYVPKCFRSRQSTRRMVLRNVSF